jgi:transcriptional regulator with XRE-family HTH domain
VAVHQRQTVRRRRVGAQLRRTRERAGLTIEQAATLLGYSSSKVSRIETGRIGVTPGDLREMFVLYGGSEEQLDFLIQIIHEDQQQRWWQAYRDVFESPYATYEAAAASIDSYAGLLVPGLLQTSDYAGAVLRALRPQVPADEAARRIEFRMLRQTIFSGDDPPAFSVVLDEAVLRRRVGSRHLMARQLQRLMEASTHPSITLRVLSFDAGEHPGMDGALTLLQFSDEGDADLVYFETPIRTVVYSDDPEVILDSRRALERLQGAAMTPDESTAFMAGLAEELSRG